MLREILASIKEIILDYIKSRLFPITVLVIVLFSILVHRLFVLQIKEGQEHMDNFTYKSEKTLTIESVRGNIYDCNGKLIAYNELSYSVIFSNDPNLSNQAKELGMSENELKNKVVYDTVQILEKNKDELYIDFPIELDKKNEFQFTVKDQQLKTFLKNVYAKTDYDSLSDKQKNSTPQDIVDYLNEMYEISDSYEPKYDLYIIACRYKLWMNRYQQYVPVTIAYDISEESNAAITEHADELIGMSVSVKSLRRYNEAKYYAHIIGYIGGISDEELKTVNANLSKEEQYLGEEMIGKTGIEQYCESELRGTTGSETMYVDNLGKVIEVVETRPATAGNDVYLTLDTELQKYCYDTLEKEIASIILSNLTPMATAPEEENPSIPITDIYYGLFNNNYIKLSEMEGEEATDLEREVLSSFKNYKQSTLDELNKILTVDFTPLSGLNEYYREHMEYICEMLSENDVLHTSLIDQSDQEFIDYTNNLTSLEHYLKYAISIEAIDIDALHVESDYYDNDEIYAALCDYILQTLSEDTEFDKQILRVMLQSGEISGATVVHLLYDQEILNPDGDQEYQLFLAGNFGAYDFMRKKIENLQITPAMLALDTCSGSVVVTDVKTGDVKAMVSYPSYDNNFLTNEVDSDYYNQLLEDKTMPLYNRACQTRMAPGSTFKPLASMAGLMEKVIDEGSVFYCGGVFDKIEPPPHCWKNMSHGGLSVSTAIQHSCNVFFYNLGYSLAIDKNGKYNDSYGLERLEKYVKLLGLGEKSGVELTEIEPQISDNDSVRSAIGQGTNAYAPIQISRYVTTIANSGTCYNLTLIDKVTDYEGNLVRDNHATIRNKVEATQSAWDAVHLGMRNVVQYDAPSYELVNKVNVAVAGKTGTAQESEVKADHALFMSYAPFENPEVTVTCVIPNGYYSSNARELAGFIYAYMYDPDKLVGAEMGSTTTTEAETTD